MASTTELNRTVRAAALPIEPVAVARRPAISDWWRTVAATVIGAGVALSGFPPINNITELVHVDALPGFALATPAVVLALIALYCSRPGLRQVPAIALVALGLTLLGGFLSLFQSANLDQSAAYFVLGIVAPAGLFLAVRRGNLPGSVLAGSFLTALTALLMRADIVFVQAEGIPTPSRLLYEKFANEAYDFHYYTLGNPDHAGAFLVLPFTFCVTWALRREHSVRTRRLLLFSALVMLVTLVLLYVRLDLLIAVVVMLLAVMLAPWRRRVRAAVIGLGLAAIGVFALASPGHYLADLFSTKHASSGQVRVSSISAGWHAMLEHPLTGVGLGQYGANGTFPAHSLVVQTAAEMGIWGFTGIVLITLALPLALLWRLRRRASAGSGSGSGSGAGAGDVEAALALPAASWFTVRNAALVGAAVYIVSAGASAPEGLFVGAVSVYALTLAMFSGIGLAPEPRPSRLRVRTAFKVAAEDVWVALSRRLGRRRVGAGWLVYCGAWVPLGGWLVSRQSGPAVITGSRLTNLQQLSAAIAHHVGPMVQMLGSGTFIPAGLGDDPGAYFVYPWLSSLLGTNNPHTIFRAVFIAVMAITVAVYPIFVRRLTGSTIAALLSPVAVLLVFSFMTDYGFYWLPAAMVALCLPWLLILLRSGAAPLLALTAIAAIAGTTSLFRSGSGYGVLVAAALVALLSYRPRRIKAVGLVLMAASYLFFSSGAVSLAYQARGEHMASYPLITKGVAGVNRWSDGSGEPLWHTIYISFGFIKNPYGIRYVDASAVAYVRRIDPSARYQSARYEAILRRRVLHIVTTNPGFVLHVEAFKLRNEISDGLSKVPLLVIVLPIAAVLALRRRRRARWGPVILPVALLAIAPPLVSVPEPTYEFAWLALLGTFTVLCLAWLIAVGVEEVVGVAGDPRYARAFAPIAAIAGELEQRRLRSAAVGRRWQSGTSSRVGAWLAVIARPLAVVVRSIRRLAAAIWTLLSDTSVRGALRALARSRGALLTVALITGGLIARSALQSLTAVPPPALSGPTLPFNTSFVGAVRLWDADAGLQTVWSVAPPTVRTPGPSTIGVTTSKTNQYYALVSPTVALSAGNYVVAVRGRIQSGGMVLGVLDVAKQSWVAEDVFGTATAGRSSTLPLSFQLSSAKLVEVILSNFNPSNRPSSWSIAHIVLARGIASTKP